LTIRRSKKCSEVLWRCSIAESIKLIYGIIEQELRDTFGVSGAKSDSATARGSILYDVLNDKIVDAAIGKYSRSEREFAKEHISQLAKICKSKQTIIIFDRGYPSFLPSGQQETVYTGQ